VDASPVAEQLETPASNREIAVWAVLLVTAIGLLIWKHFTVYFFSWTDEQIHFYVARRMAEGAVLYRDIESARPPLALLPLSWFIRMGISPLFAGRAIVFCSELAIGGLLFWGGRGLVSWRVGALSALLFLTSPEAFSRVHYTGIHLAALTASACAIFSLRAQPWRAGLCLGLSLAADQHGLAVCAIVGFLTLVRRPRDAIRFVLGTLIVFVIVFGGVWLMGSRHLWKSLVEIHLFHLRLGQSGNEFWEQFTPWLYEHGYLFAGAVVAIGALGFRRIGTAAVNDSSRAPRSRIVRILALAVAGHIAVVLAMTDASFLYIVVISPLLCLLAGMGFEAIAQRCRGWNWPRCRGALATGVAVLALTIAGWSAARSHREHLDQRHYSFLPHILHGQVSRFLRLDLARQVAGDLPKDGTIFGDPTFVSTVALDSGRRVSGELADLNPIWIQAGMIKREEVVSRIERDGVEAVITPAWFLVQDPFFSAYLARCYGAPKIYSPAEGGDGEGIPDVLVFHHVHDSILCKVPPI
jgi:hypothetical protein